MQPNVITTEMFQALRKTMVAQMAVDEKIHLDEIHRIKHVVKDLTGRELGDDEIQEDFDAVKQQPESAFNYLESVSGILSDSEKESIIRAAMMVSMSDGHVHDEEKSALIKCAESMGVHINRFAEIMKEFQK